MTDSELTAEQAEAHWAKTKRLMWTHLTIWFIFSFFIHFFVSILNSFTFLGFPFGFYMAAQGSLVVFVIQIFFFAWQQNRIDEEFGIAEEQ